MFFFTPLDFEVKGIRMEVEDMDDADLVDEVNLLCPDDQKLDKIIYSYITQGVLLDDEREMLINYYVLYNIEDYLMIMEDGEL